MSHFLTVSWPDDVGDVGPCEVVAEVELVGMEDVDNRTTVHGLTLVQNGIELDERDVDLSWKEHARLQAMAVERAKEEV